MFKDTLEGTTHSYNDGCGEPAHNTPKKTLRELYDSKLSDMDTITQLEKDVMFSLFCDLFSQMIEEERKTMKDTHLCRFNDGEQQCDCYFAALDSLKAKLKE
jgi:hypothetical protein